MKAIHTASSPVPRRAGIESGFSPTALLGGHTKSTLATLAFQTKSVSAKIQFAWPNQRPASWVKLDLGKILWFLKPLENPTSRDDWIHVDDELRAVVITKREPVLR
jgi:hypothetical protein